MKAFSMIELLVIYY